MILIRDVTIGKLLQGNRERAFLAANKRLNLQDFL